MAMRPPGQGGPLPVPDIRAGADQQRALEAQKELARIQIAQQVRGGKAQHAMNFLALWRQDQTAPNVAMMGGDTPGGIQAKESAYRWLTKYFDEDTDREQGIPEAESDIFPHGSSIATA